MLVVFLSCLILACNGLSPFSAELNEEWENYKVKYERKYSGIEEQGRRLAWEQNVLKINKHNLEADMGMHTYWMGVNKFTDRTAEEREEIRRCLTMPANFTNTRTSASSNKNLSLPDSVDWRDKGYVTNVKDQGNCGSCWAFSSTGALEGQHKAFSGNLVSLSEQNLVDCAWGYECFGCNGGFMMFAFVYVFVNNGIDTEESYPYTAEDGDCRFNPATVGATCRGFTLLPNNEASLQEAVADVGPISIGIYANENFMNYKSGVFYDSECYGNVNHGVLAVGYGTQDNANYWIVKNSWGGGWGTGGYVLMARNRDNNCEIASMASYPLM